MPAGAVAIVVSTSGERSTWRSVLARPVQRHARPFVDLGRELLRLEKVHAVQPASILDPDGDDRVGFAGCRVASRDPNTGQETKCEQPA